MYKLDLTPEELVLINGALAEKEDSLVREIDKVNIDRGDSAIEYINHIGKLHEELKLTKSLRLKVIKQIEDMKDEV